MKIPGTLKDKGQEFSWPLVVESIIKSTVENLVKSFLTSFL
jgi:hypothetical protein